jgi:signal transduction histidine kinase
MKDFQTLSKNELLGEIELLKRQNIELKSVGSENEKKLQERVKELNCLYTVSQMIENENLSIDELLKHIVTLIPASWQYPEIACSKIIFNNNEYLSHEVSVYSTAVARQECNIYVHGAVAGQLVICYTEVKPDEDEGPFLAEERHLLEEIADRIGRYVERDISRQKTDLQQKLLIQADKMASLGILVASVAHEINNPNNSIMLNVPIVQNIIQYAKPLLDRKLDEEGDFKIGNISYSVLRDEINNLFESITGSSQRIKEIVKDLKNFTRDTGNDKMEQVDLNSVIESAMKLLKNMMNKYASNVTVDLQKNIPPIIGNFQRLEQVAVNLIQNACQAACEKRLQLIIKTRYDESSSRLVFSVIDNGCGIEKTHFKNIADPFFTTKREKGGIGLGLSISMEIIRNHNGTMQFNSEEGEGTTVDVLIPCADLWIDKAAND